MLVMADVRHLGHPPAAPSCLDAALTPMTLPEFQLVKMVQPMGTRPVGHVPARHAQTETRVAESRRWTVQIDLNARAR